jgi:cell wall assembly regulator SMI1
VDTIQLLWRRIETSLQMVAPSAETHLAPGATEHEIKQLEEVLAVAVPEDFRASYRLRDGGFTMELVTSMEFLPVERIAETWKLLEELLHDEEWANQAPHYFSDEVVRAGWQTSPIQPVWWHRRWIPFASDSRGQSLLPGFGPGRRWNDRADHRLGS